MTTAFCLTDVTVNGKHENGTFIIAIFFPLNQEKIDLKRFFFYLSPFLPSFKSFGITQRVEWIVDTRKMS